MAKKDNVEKIIDAMSVAYSDPEVKKDSHMHEVLFHAAKQITSGHDYRPVCVRLRREISFFSMRNNLTTPESLNNLYDLIQTVHITSKIHIPF